MRWLEEGIKSAIIVFIGLVWSWDIGPHGENPHGMIWYLMREYTSMNPIDWRLSGPFMFALPYCMSIVGILAWLGNWWMIGRQEFHLTAVKIIATSALIAFPLLTMWNHHWYEKNHEWERFHDERTKAVLPVTPSASHCDVDLIIDTYVEYTPPRKVYRGKNYKCYNDSGILVREFQEYQH
jgi:hypothetical protein